MQDTALSFAAEVEQQIEALSSEDYRLKKGRGKVLLEEWYPISRLALHLKQPGNKVNVEAFGDSGAADGRITESGFRDRVFDVQVTFVDDYEGALRREHMQLKGVVPGTGPISRHKATGDVVATMTAVDFDYNLKQVASGISERFQKKAEMAYPANTALLIAFEDMTLLGRGMWESLLHHVDTKVSFAKSNFVSVYIINCATNELVKVA